MASLRELEHDVQPVAQWFVRVLQSRELQQYLRLARPVAVTVTSARRDMTQQAKLYADFKAGRSKYPAAAPGKSTHGQGIAFDLHLDPPIYSVAGAIWEALGLTWGGRFSDEIHFDARPRRA